MAKRKRDAKNRRLLAAIAAVGTMEEVAERAGVNRSTLSGWVNRRTSPNLDKLKKLAAIVGKPVTELIED